MHLLISDSYMTLFYAVTKPFELINQNFNAQEENIKCCLISGSVARSWGGGGSKLRVFVHRYAMSALS